MASGCSYPSSLPRGFVELLEEIVQSVVSTQPTEPLQHISAFLEILIDRRTLLQMQSRQESPEGDAQTTAKAEISPQKSCSSTKNRRPRPVKKTSKKACSASQETFAAVEAPNADTGGVRTNRCGSAASAAVDTSCDPWRDPFIIASHRAQHDAIRHVIEEIEAVNSQIMDLEESLQKGTRGAQLRQLSLKHSQLQRTLQKLPLACGLTYGGHEVLATAGCPCPCPEISRPPCRKAAARPKAEGVCCKTEKYQKELEQRMTCLKETMEQVIRGLQEGGVDPSKKPATRRTPNQQKVEYERLLQDLALLNQWLQNMSESISQDGSACKTPDTVFHLQILNSSFRRAAAAAKRPAPKTDECSGQQQQQQQQQQQLQQQQQQPDAKGKGKECMAIQYYMKDAQGKVTMVEAGSRELLAQIQGQQDRPRAESLPYPKTTPSSGEDPNFLKFNSDSMLMDKKSNVMKASSSRPCVGQAKGSSTKLQGSKASAMHLTSSQTDLFCLPLSQGRDDIEPPPRMVSVQKASNEDVGQRSTEKVRSALSVNSRETIQTVKSATSKDEKIASTHSTAKTPSFRNEKVSSHQSVAKVSSFRDEKAPSCQSIAKTSSFRDEKIPSHQSILRVASIKDEKAPSCQSIAKSSSFRDEKIPSHQSIQKIASIQDEKAPSCQSIAKSSSFRDEKIPSHQSILRVASIKDENVSSHQSVSKVSSFRDEKVPSTQSIAKSVPIRDEAVLSNHSVARVQKMEGSNFDSRVCHSKQTSASSMMNVESKTQQQPFTEHGGGGGGGGQLLAHLFDPPRTPSHHSAADLKQTTQQPSTGSAATSTTATTTTKKTTTIRLDQDTEGNAFSQLSVESIQGTATNASSTTGRDVRFGPISSSDTQKDRYSYLDGDDDDDDIAPPTMTIRAHKNASETSIGSQRLSNNPSVNSSGIQSF